MWIAAKAPPMMVYLISILGLLLGTAPLWIGLLFGSWLQRRHLEDVMRREEEMELIPMNTRTLPEGVEVEEAFLCSGSIVIAADPFRTLIAGLINLFGGRVTSFERMLSLARREATLRVLEEAESQGADLILNMRFETSTMGRAAGNQGISMVEIYAYATAVRIK
jgi:uncharacterized protein YbjQ (UPF0145 family)